MDKRITVPVLDRKTNKVINVSPGIKAGMLRHHPKRYEDVEEVEEVEKVVLFEYPTEEIKEAEPLEEKAVRSPEDMNMTELRGYAKEKGMKNTSRKYRSEIMEFINNL